MDAQEPYKEMYFLLFDAMTDWIEQMKQAQQRAEAIFMQEQAEQSDEV